MRRRLRSFALLVACGAWLCFSLAGQAPAAELDVAAVTAQLGRLEANQELPKATKDELRTLYEAARASLLAAVSTREGAEALAARREGVPARITEIQQRLGTALPPPPSGLGELETDALEAGGNAALTELRAAEAELQRVAKQIEERSERLPKLPEEIQKKRDELEQLRQQLQLGAPLPAELDVAAANRWKRRAQAKELEATLASLQARLAWFENAGELLRLERELAQRRLELAQRDAKAWEQALEQRRKREADEAAARARRRAAELIQHPVLSEIAADNVALRERLSGPVAREELGLRHRLARVKDEVRAVETRLAELRKSREQLVKKLRVAGPNRAIGILLRRQYQQLPSLPELERLGQEKLQQFEEATYDRILLEEQRERLPALVSRELEQLIAKHPTADWSEDVREKAIEILRARRQNLDQLIETYNKDYEQALWTLYTKLRDLLHEAAEFRSFLQEYILWVRSVSGSLVPGLGSFERGLDVLLDRASLARAFGEPMDRGVLQKPGTFGVLVLLLVLVALRRVGRRRQRHIAERVARAQTDRFHHTIEALFWAIVRAALWPALLLCTAYYLLFPVAPSAYATGLASTLDSLARIVLPLLLLHEITRPGGIGEVHLRWSRTAARAVRRLIRRALPVLLVSDYVSTLLEQVEGGPGHESLGRLAFVVFLCTWAVLLHAVFRRQGNVLGPYYKRRPTSLLSRGAKLWHGLGVGVPLFLALLALVGYQFTAHLVALRLLQTLALGFVWLLAHALLLRWLFVAKRRAALEQASAKAEAQERPPEELEPDLIALNAQSRRLFGTALFVSMFFALFSIWSDVIPALNVLGQIEVYPRFLVVDRAEGLTDRPAGETPAEPRAEPEAKGESAATTGTGLPRLPGMPLPAATDENGQHRVTLANVFAAILILLLMILLVRNVPALLEIILLARLPLDHGVRFAISTVTRYLLVIIGTSLTLGTIGIGWSQLQWLVAALTFGLAFGLQEIFANLVSGLIILFEQPVRVGDIVTVGDVDGEVTRIRMRATTITSFERKEFLVPNKEFITGKLVNWTLSDPITRMTINVGIAYGSDTHEVTKILLKIAREHPLVLDNPRPRALFLGFGDSVLNFQLRVFFDDLNDWSRLIHDMHTLVHERLRAEGIEIAFPQRDLHVRSAEGLSALLQREGAVQIDTLGAGRGKEAE